MKTKLMLLLSLIIALPAAQAADNKDKDKDKGLPPGLQKKDNLPPGIAKRRGAGTSIVTNTTITTNIIVTNVIVTNFQGRARSTPTAPAIQTTPRTEAVKVDLERRTRAINMLDNRDAVRRAGMAAISSETGVTLATLQRQRRDYENIGTAGLLLGNAIAAKTKRPVAAYFRQRVDGRSWEQIAAANQVNLEELEAKLARVETAMRSAK